MFGRAGAPTAKPAQAVQASCAIPGFFEPPVIGGQRYIDGGVHSTTNADLVVPERLRPGVISAPMSVARRAARLGPSLPMRQIARLSLVREVAGLQLTTFQPTAADLAAMGDDSLDPSVVGPVRSR